MVKHDKWEGDLPMLRDDESLFEIFTEDLLEQISFLDASLLAIERSSEDEETLTSLFRVFHSVKGLFFTMEYQLLGDYFHDLETIIQSTRANHSTLPQSFLDLVIALRDSLEVYVTMLKSDKNLVYKLSDFKIEVLNTLYPTSISERLSPETILLT